MKKTDKFNLILTLSIIFILPIGCSSDFLDEEPLTFYSEENFYNTTDGMEQALIGLYSVLQSTIDLDGGGRNVFFDAQQVGTDVAEPIPHKYVDPYRTFAEYNVDWNAQNSSSYIWQPCYAALNPCNSLLANIDRPEWDTDAQKNRIKGNALFFRAYWYYWLVSAYGDVPLVTEPISSPKTDFVRTPKSTVIDQMINDLTEAVNILPELGTYEGEIGKGAAEHLLTYVYLMKEDWSNAEHAATQLINSGTFRLMTERFGIEKDQPGTPFTDLFIDGNINRWEGNEEMIWALQIGNRNILSSTGNQLKTNWLTEYDQVEGLARSLEYWQRSKAYARASQHYLNLFDPEYQHGENLFSPISPDDRGSKFAIKTIWRYNDASYIAAQKAKGTPLTQIVNGVEVEVEVGDTVMINDNNRDFLYPMCTKLMDVFGTNISETRTDKDFPLMRLAETYLYRAEARFHLGDLDGASEDINTIRRRSNAPDITADDVDMDFILDERARELFQEESRRLILMRMGKLVERNKLYNKYSLPYISEKHNLYPIPQVEIDRMKDSPDFPQNPGW